MPSPTLIKIAATWSTPFSQESWKKLEELKRTASTDGTFLSVGPALPDDDDDRIADLVVHHHEDQSELHWALSVKPRPNNDPPEKIREHDKLIGGRKGLSALLLSGFSGQLPAIGSFLIDYSVPEVSFRCPNIPVAVERGSLFDAALRLGDARLEQVGYRFDGGATSGIEEVVIIYAHERREYRLSIDANGLLKFNSPRWLPFADDVAEIVMGTFFLSTEAVA